MSCGGTKNRLPLIESAWEFDLHDHIWGKASELDCVPHAIGCMPDHLHIVISIPPKLSVATLIGKLKGASSYQVNEKHNDAAFAWQPGFGTSSFSEKSLSAMVDYVKNQKKHHSENMINAALEIIQS